MPIIRMRRFVEKTLRIFDYYLLSIGDINSYFLKEIYLFNYVTKDEILSDYIILDEKVIIERVKYINYVINAFNKLTKEERIIIYYLYMNKVKTTSEIICEKLSISLSKYFRDKNEAIVRLAYALGVEESTKNE